MPMLWSNLSTLRDSARSPWSQTKCSLSAIFPPSHVASLTQLHSFRLKQASPKPRMSTRNRLLFLFTGWLIVLMPFLFWWSTWFGRQLPDKQLANICRTQSIPGIFSMRWYRLASA